jgi:hypothetical protein
MKKLSILITTIIIAQSTSAQISIALTLNPRPVANITQWSARRDVLTLIATAPAQAGTRSVKINTTIKTTDGTIVATTDLQRAPFRQITAGTNNIFYAADVINLESLVFKGSYQNKLNSTGKLPAGSYQVIVELDSASLPVPLSNTQTRIFFLASTQLPILVSPAGESVLDKNTAQSVITFRWTPVVPRPQEAVRYQLKVFEIGKDQSPIQAMRSNQPLLDKEMLNATQFNWKPQLAFADSSRFVWTIQSLDFKQQPITGDLPNGEGLSEVLTFSINSTITADKLAKRVNQGL